VTLTTCSAAAPTGSTDGVRATAFANSTTYTEITAT
jgi:hypothetical protein